MKESVYDVTVVDYGLGNLFSVKSACEKVGLKTRITSDPHEVATSQAIILPGVGAFGDAVKSLKEKKITSSINMSVGNGAYVIGICLGMQLLMTKSEEFGMHDGLDLIPGQVRQFPMLSAQGTTLKVPNVGWSPVYVPLEKRVGTQSFPELSGAHMYFVHSYYVEPVDESVVTFTSEYGGIKFCAGVRFGNIFGFQFHPEKSGKCGLSLYAKLARLIKEGE